MGDPLEIAQAERDLCIEALKVLERRHSARCRLANLDESDSETLRIIRRVLRVMPKTDERTA